MDCIKNRQPVSSFGSILDLYEIRHRGYDGTGGKWKMWDKIFGRESAEIYIKNCGHAGRA
jgi:hypothetical protein